MASTDTRSGFRLPWSSDRSHDQQPAEPTADETAAIGDGSELEVAGADSVVWPDTDLNARLGLTSQPRPADHASDGAANDVTPTSVPEDAPMLDQEATPVTARPAPRKPSRLMVELSAAIRATAETAREQALAQVDADVAQVVDAIRSGSKDGEDALRTKSDQDIAAIKEWSREEIARIKAETETRIGDRRTQLTAELDAHAAAIETRVAEVVGTADDYRSAIAGYAARLEDEDDPSLLATMAESMPEPPSLESLADLGSLEWSVPDAAPEPEPAAAVATVLAAPEPELVDADAGASATADAQTAEPEAGDRSEAAPGDAEPTVGVAETVEPADAGATEPAGEWPAAADAVDAAGGDPAANGWGEPNANEWGDGHTTWRTEPSTDDDDTPRWAAGETPEGFPEVDEAGDPVDRGAIMAALEAAAEAVVAAESAAESAGQAEAAADVAETAAELLKGRVGDDELDPEAHAAMAARVDAGGVEESYTDRLAKLLPAHGDGAGGTEPRTTAVVVSGLVSVASIASFKRHLGRVPGVQNVTVASGPEGEFVFNVTHLPDVSFRDAVPTMPGFAARVTASAEGTVQVTARDPEAEG